MFKILLLVVGLSALFSASVLFYMRRRAVVTQPKSESRIISVDELLNNMEQYNYAENNLAVKRMLKSCRAVLAVGGKLMAQNKSLSSEEVNNLILLVDDFNNHCRIILEISKKNSNERSCALICRDIVNKIYISLLGISR